MRHNFSSNTRVSIGSQSSKGANELAVLLEYIDKLVADIDIESKLYNRFHWGTSVLQPNLQNIKFNLQNIEFIGEAQFVSLIFRHDDESSAEDAAKATKIASAPESQPPIFGFETVENLNSLSEVELQTILSKNVDAALAVDTHASRCHMIEFIMARSFVKDTVFSNTGKCDLTSLQRRMAFEVKAPNCGPQLVLQIIQRVTVALDVSHILSNAIAFGLTGDRCYICIGTRVIPESRSASHQKSIHLFQLAVADIDKFWRIASNCQPEDYLTADGAHILHALRLASPSLNPFTCRIRLLDWSDSRVYELSLPDTFEFPSEYCSSADEEGEEEDEGSQSKGDTRSGKNKKRCCRGVSASAAGEKFSLKVLLDGGTTAADQNEVAMNEAIEPAHYCGSVTFSSSSAAAAAPTCKILSATSASFAQHSYADNIAATGWFKRCPKLPQQGCVIFMRCGVPFAALKSCLSLEKVYNDCFNDLVYIHEKGYVHTDVRMANIVKFGDKFSLVDFGLAVRAGSLVNLATRSEFVRRYLVSPEKAQCESVSWVAALDFDMLVRSIFFKNNSS